LAALEPFRGQRAVLMGDMNFRRQAATSGLLRDAGWELAAFEDSWTIDQIWLAPWTGWTAEKLWEPGTIVENLSDHYPVGVRLDFGEHRPEAPRENLIRPRREHACEPG
jgi:hypothetical protein